MATAGPPLEDLPYPDAQIAWVLAHPGMSPWLKNAVRTALDGDPTQVLNDLKILRYLLSARCDGFNRPTSTT